jgi:hypothetical protein
MSITCVILFVVFVVYDRLFLLWPTPLFLDCVREFLTKSMASKQLRFHSHPPSLSVFTRSAHRMLGSFVESVQEKTVSGEIMISDNTIA